MSKPWPSDFHFQSLSGYKYQITKLYSFATPFRIDQVHAGPFLRMGKGGRVSVDKGYAWDGASGPFTMDTPSTMRASLIHDALYQLMREEVLPQSARLEADKILRRIAVEDGMWKPRARLWVWALKHFGGRAAKA